MGFVLMMAAAAAAVAIEMLEALAIVLAVGMARGLRDALSESAWETGGGFALAVLVIAALANSLRARP